MTAANVEAIYRLSPTQEGMLYHCLVNGAQERGGGDGSYLVQYSCVYHEVDAERLRQAWNRVAERHAALRTLFTWERRSQPLQVVRRRIDLHLEQQDWHGLPDAEQTRRFDSHAQRDRDLGFDLERAPLMRLLLVRLDEQRSRFLWSFHHLLLDGWSMRLVLDEVTRIYAALGRGETPELPPARPYGDFIAWLERRDSAGDEAFWRDYLRGFDTPTLPALPRPAVAAEPTRRSAAVRERMLAAETMAALGAQARRERLTVSVLVLAAWALVLSRHVDSDDVVFGTTVAGRPPDLPGVEQMAGLFINTLPLRVRVRVDAALRDWLADVQRQQRALLAHEHTPLVSVKRAAGFAAGRQPFESLVSYTSVPAQHAANAGLDTRDERYVEYSHYPLALIALPDSGLELVLVYDPARYGGDAAGRLLGQVASVLEAMSVSLDGVVGSLPVLPPAELAQAVPPPAATAADLGAPRCVHELIREQARRNPAATAVLDADGALDYGELSAAADRLAARLAARGVVADTPVPVLAGRSRAAVTAILAVLRAGGAYVPMDPEWPAERIARVLDDLERVTALPAVLCEPQTRALLGDRAALAMTPDEAGEAGEPPPPAFPADPGQLAYVIYTSGTTGAPKGVMVEHASLYNSVKARDRFYPRPPRVFLLLSPLATDSSIAGLFWTLCTGGTLLLPAHRAEQDPQALAALVAEHGASHTLCLPSLWATLLELADPARLASLETVVVAGEACRPEVVARHHRTLPSAALYNEYGPSEATVWATAACLGPEAAASVVPLGQPIANTRVYVLDRSLRPAPMGAPGELCIGGANLARGYYGLPERTARSFVPDPFADAPGARLYRTGDRVRRHEDGTLEYLGRVDDQIKVRGYRVEPQEIEAALDAHPAVAESAVGLAAEPPGDADTDDPAALAQALARLDPGQVETLLAEVERLAPGEVDAWLQRA